MIKGRIEQMVEDINTSTTEQGSEFRTTATTNVYSEHQITGEDLGFDYTKFPDAISSSRVRLHMHHNTANPENGKIQPVFSAEDVFGMAKFYKQKKDNNDTDREKITSILVSRRGLYALRIDDAEKVEQFYESLNTNVVYDNKVMKKYQYLQFRYNNEVIEATIKYCGTCTDGQEEALFEAFFVKFFNTLDSGSTLFQAFADTNGDYSWQALN